MATRSTIGIENGDGTTTYIYCHWDGYLDYTGRMLIEHYNTKERVEALIALGDLSYLNEKISPDPNIEHSFDKPQKAVCVAYHRDRGEKFSQEKIKSSYYNIQSMTNALWADFVYLWKDGEWLYQKIRYLNGEMLYSDWKSLQEAVAKKMNRKSNLN